VIVCGISAIFAIKNDVKLSLIVSMNGAIRHRGPDDEGYVCFSSLSGKPMIFGGNDTPRSVLESQLPYCPSASIDPSPRMEGMAALGHRRLSILDLSSHGHQPLCNSEGNLWITYNGEVYNYIEIKSRLEKLGHNFKTKTDTEVILKAYEVWGESCLQHFNGMFAFVIYDSRSRKVFAARDRFGVKPLYFWSSPAGFVAFASEVKQFTFLEGWEAALNRQRAYDFLQWGVFDHTEETLFEGVFQLRGGESVTFSVGSQEYPRKKRWYSLMAQEFRGDMAMAAAQFAELFQDAIDLRLRADVDIGSCLSGGLDSSSIVCLVNRQMRKRGAITRQKTFSACSELAHIDEKRFIDLVVDHTEVDAYYTYPSYDNLLEECEKMVWHQDEPFGSTSIYAQWLVFKLAREKGVKVMLDGQGADEQLAGYHGFFGNYFYDLFYSGRWKDLYNEIRIAKERYPEIHPLRLFGGRILPKFLRQPIKNALLRRTNCELWFNPVPLGADRGHPFLGENADTMCDQSMQQLLSSNLPMLLHYEDRDSMAHGVESRTPFLDYRLVEFNLGLPSHMKISGGWTKHVMREGMREVLPEKIRMRADKIGFATAEQEWMRRNPEAFKKVLMQAVDNSQGIVSLNALQLFDRMIDGSIPFDFTPWRMISFGLWMERFRVGLRF
jgi:asparagine synthase (glutamine-hydrolysing)